MKYVLTGLAGLLLGAIAAAGVVYFNPLIANRSAPADLAADWRLDYSFPTPGVLSHTHGGALPSPLLPAGVQTLWEETIGAAALTTLPLDAGGGASLWATRISVPSTKTNLIFNGVVVSDHWLVSMPGAGSLFMTAETNAWPVLKDTYLGVELLGRAWSGRAAYSPTLRVPGAAAVHGGTGRFAGAAGTFVETLEIGAYDRVAGIESMTGRLTVDFDGQAPLAGPAE